MADNLLNVGVLHYIMLALILFAIGIIGLFINKKSLISVLISIEIIFLAVNLNFITFSVFLGNYIGQSFVLFIMAISAAEIAIGLTILVVIFNSTGNIWVENTNNKE